MFLNTIFVNLFGWEELMAKMVVVDLLQFLLAVVAAL
jgi:hypothetical protein